MVFIEGERLYPEMSMNIISGLQQDFQFPPKTKYSVVFALSSAVNARSLPSRQLELYPFVVAAL
jgi:hypothetical protein